MKGRKKRDTGTESAKPFFARFLEGQEDTEATVSSRPSRAQATTKGAKKAAAPLQTLKYPSDRDELVLCPYHVEYTERPKGSKFQTLKFPSDSDEDSPFYALYLNAKDVPKAATAKPKDAQIRITRKAADKDEVG